jgi:hypothetical protein
MANRAKHSTDLSISTFVQHYANPDPVFRVGLSRRPPVPRVRVLAKDPGACQPHGERPHALAVEQDTLPKATEFINGGGFGDER